MKKKQIIAILCVLLFALSGCGSTDTTAPEIQQPDPVDAVPPAPAPMDGDFRYGTWGMSKEEVRGLESAEFLGEAVDGWIEFFTYEGELLGFPVIIQYEFYNDELYRGNYKFHDPYQVFYTAEQEVASAALIEKYGEPDETFSNYLRWFVDDTEITLLFNTPGTQLFLVYENPEMEAAIPIVPPDTTGI